MCMFYITMSNSGGVHILVVITRLQTAWGCLDTVDTNGLTPMDGSPQRGLGAKPQKVTTCFEIMHKYFVYLTLDHIY